MSTETNPTSRMLANDDTRLQTRKCNAETVEAVLATIEAGASVRDACARHGVGKTRFYAVVAETGQSERLKNAQRSRDADMRESAVEAIRAAFGEDWRAAAWWLERNFPREFSTQLALRADDGGETRVHVRIGGADA